ncbi:late-transcription coactivator [Vibrio phage 1.244.A._10N.261.54.C3]|nr:late-transcription coactivator [Vibrio phage 1.244.A._10N.261.54.C3]AUR98697.1 late-transcription coactivator [Vibrio phage 1.255.O._10N.286.45.F1]
MSETKEASLPSADEFSREVLQASKDNGIGVIEATADICEKYDIPCEDVKKFTAEPLRVAIHAEAANLHLLKGKNKTRKLF